MWLSNSTFSPLRMATPPLTKKKALFDRALSFVYSAEEKKLPLHLNEERSYKDSPEEEEKEKHVPYYVCFQK